MWLNAVMTATEVIDQIEALPPEERAKVVDFIRQAEAAQNGRLMGRKIFERSAKQVFDRHAELMPKLSR